MAVEMFHDQFPRKNVADPVGANPRPPNRSRIRLSHRGRQELWYITKVRIVTLARDKPCDEGRKLGKKKLKYYQYGSYGLHNISVSYKGDKYITEKERVVSLAHDLPVWSLSMPL